MKWYNLHGGFNNTGNHYNALLGGSPNDSGPFGVDLRQAHANGFGKGVGFEQIEDLIKFKLDLVLWNQTEEGVPVYNTGTYIQGNGDDYRWYLNIQLSNNNQTSWYNIFDSLVFSHPWEYCKIYSIVGDYSWIDTAIHSQWEKNFNIPLDTTHVKIELYGENSTFPFQNIFTIADIITDFRPFAIRKSGIFKSLDVNSGFLRKRNNGTWKDIPKMQLNQQGVANVGTSRIRKSSIWKGQTKIGQ